MLWDTPPSVVESPFEKFDILLPTKSKYNSNNEHHKYIFQHLQQNREHNRK